MFSWIARRSVRSLEGIAPSRAIAALLAAGAVVLTGCSGASGPVLRHHDARVPHPRTTVAAETHRQVPRMQPPSDERALRLVRTVTGAISPKSVVAGPGGRVFAQNMMYRHTVTVYDHRGRLLRTIPDSVDLSDYGVEGHPGVSHGAPVEAAVAADRRHVFVSNYSMYGAGFGPEGSDTCTPTSAAAAGVSPSFVYRIALHSLRIDAVYQVGRVPKFLATTPDGRWLLVSNWCSYSVSIVDLASGREVAQVPVGAYPRGIAVTRDSRRAYVAVMGGTSIAVVDLGKRKVVRSIDVGDAPRHVVLDPRGRRLYVTLNALGRVVTVDLRRHKVVDSVVTGQAPRTMAMAPDGRTLYVVNYLSDTLSVVRARDLTVLQTVPVGDAPIGVTYDRRGDAVWVALYSGQLAIYAAR